MNDSEFRIIADSNSTPGIMIEKDGIHFGYYACTEETPVLLLYRKGTEEVVAELPFPKQNVSGSLYTMKVRFQPSQYEYNFREGDAVVTDPYAKKISGRERFGQEPSESPHAIRGGFTVKKYNWGEDCLPQIPYNEAVMYHLHVRGFTMQKNSGVRRKGTFAGLKEKIPYLKELGINQVKLMPVYEFAEVVPRISRKRRPPKSQSEAKERAFEKQNPDGLYKLNYWGYGDGFYFAPKASYAAGKNPEDELKDMVKAFHGQGIEVLLEFCFTDRADVSMIGQCLDHWANEYHIDGFSIIARESVSAELARLPLFRKRKLICNWFPDSVKEYNREENFCQLAQSNDGFMNDCRRLLKGDGECLEAFSHRLRSNPAGCAEINYMTNHDGFTLMDLVSYNQKHNLENNEQDHDGSNYNCSWNCGVEGPSKKRDIVNLRMRQRKNAYAMMLFAQGTPMLLAGDELGNTQDGNNNPYCHDSELTWVDWSKRRGNRELTDFVKAAIAYRKSHKVLHQGRELKCSDYLSSGYPDLSFHGDRAWYGDFEQPHRHLGCLYSGYYAGEEDFLYIAYNFHWDEQEFALPLLPKGQSWYKVMDTSQKESFPAQEMQECLKDAKAVLIPARTIVILEGR